MLLLLNVPTLRVGMHGRTLCVQVDAERQSMRYHAERGNDQRVLFLLLILLFDIASTDTTKRDLGAG
jgi:hypothetical protein